MSLSLRFTVFVFNAEASMRLDLCSWQEVERYLEHSTGIIIPIGSHEQHGPNGLLGTDAICPEYIARGVGERYQVLVGPTLGLGMAQHHLDFPGSISLRPTTLIAVVTDVVRSLLRHGFTHVFFLNGHGGNIATISAAFAELYADHSFRRAEAAPFHLRLGNWFMGKRVTALTDALYGASNGSHATASEVSLTYYAHPEAVKQVEMQPRVAPAGGFRDAADFRQRYPDGRVGSDPSAACQEHGRQLFEEAVEDTIASYREFTASK